jgi:rhodanese-related sulfurtransferase
MTPRKEEETSTTNLRRQYGCCGKQETNSERCHRLSGFYQGRYPDVPALCSTEFVRTYNANSTVLVDVRTVPERNVSTLEGAVSLQEFEERASLLSPETKIVTYCTIGYRSGMEARRLQYQYALEGRISSLDGIVAYTHAIVSDEKKDRASKVVDRMGHETSLDGIVPYTHALASYEKKDKAPKVVDRIGYETRNIHTFGKSWNCVDTDYEAQHFSPPVLMLRYIQVGGTVVWRTVQRITHRAGKCFHSQRRKAT